MGTNLTRCSGGPHGRSGIWAELWGECGGSPEAQCGGAVSAACSPPQSRVGCVWGQQEVRLSRESDRKQNQKGRGREITQGYSGHKRTLDFILRVTANSWKQPKIREHRTHIICFRVMMTMTTGGVISWIFTVFWTLCSDRPSFILLSYCKVAEVL